MSIVKLKNKIAIIHNLPDGGGLRMLTAIIDRYKDKCEIDLITISDLKQKKIDGVNSLNNKVIPWRGYVLFNFWVMFILPKIHQNIAKKIIWSKYNFVFVTHDYFTKSPYILRYIKNKVIYLCQEPQREFYETWRIHAPYLKDKVANIFRFPMKLIDRINVKYVSKIICNSSYSKKIIERIYGIKSEIVYPGIDENIFYPLKTKKENIVLCVGNISRIKGQDFIIRSLQPILRKYTLVLIGRGRKEDIVFVRKLIKNNKVIIKNDISDIELANYYRKAKVTCVAAYREPFGLSSIESQACGTPAVVVDEGGSRETVINGLTGYISKRNEDTFLDKTISAIIKIDEINSEVVSGVRDRWAWKATLKPLDKYFID